MGGGRRGVPLPADDAGDGSRGRGGPCSIDGAGLKGPLEDCGGPENNSYSITLDYLGICITVCKIIILIFKFKMY